MQNTDAAIQQGLAFLQTGMGLATVVVVALLALVCVLLTVLVVSQGASQRTLVARADSANRALLQIRESLANTNQPLPVKRKPVINDPNLPLRRVAGAGSDAPKSRETSKPAVRPARSDARADVPKSRETSKPAVRPARSDARTDVYVSADASDPGIQPARRRVRADARTDARKSADSDAESKSGAGASTDVFKSIDI